MKYYLLIPLLLISFCLMAQTKPVGNSDPNLMLWYDQPAEVWTEALPIGNGHMGAMIFGGIGQEHLQLNEVTLYSGDPKGTFTAIDVRKKFGEVDQLFRDGKYVEGQKIVAADWLGRNHQDYQPLGDLWLNLRHSGTATDYRRSLDLATAVSHVQYKVNGTVYKRAIFASYPDRVIVIKLTAEGSGKINGDVNFSTPHSPLAKYSASNNQIVMTGKAPGFVLRRTLDQVEKVGDQYKYPEVFAKNGSVLPNAAQVLYGQDANGYGMRFEARLKAIYKGGKIQNCCFIKYIYSMARVFTRP